MEKKRTYNREHTIAVDKLTKPPAVLLKNAKIEYLRLKL